MKRRLPFQLTLRLVSVSIIMLASYSAQALVAPGQASISESEGALQHYVKRALKRDTFPYWNNVGQIDRSTGVYLGSGYVLTAAHVGPGTFRLSDGSRYDAVRGSAQFFKNSDGSTADLCLFKIEFSNRDSVSKLPFIPLTTMVPKSGTQLLLLGAGAGGRASASDAYSWTEDYTLRWGTNSIEQIYTAPMSTSNYSSFGFAAKFGRGVHECQAAPGDSGGAAFHYNPDAKRWELAGVIVAVDSDFGRAEYGNQTYIADPALFRRELAVTQRGKNGFLANIR
tara:strand:- start:6556 stop:7401 length:846 start_codon:yes stop_codon:yes gene_type:complete